LIIIDIDITPLIIAIIISLLDDDIFADYADADYYDITCHY
jgi:hypothetical protein